ncbi:MAG: LytTR family DNA-binding domain-containing protein [Ferruginibacter sp.]
MENSFFILNTSLGSFLIDSSTIIRIEASSNYSRLYFIDGKIMVTAKLLKWFEEKLSPHLFIRLHRSHLVNNRFLVSHQHVGHELKLIDGNFIQVSRRRRKSVLIKSTLACSA